ncbi:spermatogenesis-associated protein 7 isoform X2 [Pantherophis guttatus]|uniref:Spermatogenesis-associated protein 7 isoform X2 n=1 Tax=Pantherophis guttatus TaxID=94885 RepID=A0A6P9C3I7_PANGU|nr:spermatogenesis-associated protein 7 isoform X2 [Pantherophis guttatus]
MGVKMDESGERRSWRSSPVIDYLTIPRYGLASPFKGHLSTKSNAFCIDSSSRRLSNQYLIRDHMAVHYNKILSAKAAIDCSLPKSRLNSIKYQQRREKLKIEVEKCEKEMISSQQVSRSSSRESRRLLSATYRKPTPTQDSSEPADKELVRAPCAQKYGSDPLSTPEKQSTIFQRKEKNNKKVGPKISSLSIESSDSSISGLQKLHSRVSCSSSDTTASKHSSKAQTPDSRACSGDLLDKHSQHFTNGQQPFTPRTLKSDAKSFLSQYRYYTPARRKVRENLRQQIEAETQTEISSFQAEPEAAEKKNLPSFQTITKEVEDPRFSNEQKSDEMKTISRLSSPRAISPCSVESPTMRKIQAEEEELRYLNFIQDITDEILKLGLFSNRALERLFERHIELNKNHLNKNKMRHLLEILKVDLGCNREENSAGVSDAYRHLQNESAEHLQLTSISQSKVSESEELLNAVDLITSDLTVHDDEFQRVEDQDAISQDIKELLNIELNPLSMKTDETPDNTCPLPPTCNSTTCNADFETSEYLREVDELKENMTEPISLVRAQE